MALKISSIELPSKNFSFFQFIIFTAYITGRWKNYGTEFPKKTLEFLDWHE